VSAETLRGIEDAIRAHFESTFDDDTNESRRSAVVIDWVVGYTVSNIVEVDGRKVVGFHNEYTSPDTNPNSQAYLAEWVAGEIDELMHGRIEEDDD
jgi:hypothetical protein